METQHNAFLRVALWGGNLVLQRICRNSHRFNIEIQILVGLVMALYESRWKLNTTLSMNRVGNSVLQRICRNSHRFNIEI
ncbi:hypothetical protein [Leptospira noguchii]|uniref:Uncharacterized protein n=1 Tax=Leptospira noguchii TaxID=28182 RepID=A0AAE9K9A0_9LEPT|nr:hypothetical protein [Leptospira noguchii]UOG56774.1 hypothetical protein MAL03_00655 [Leptospira noguchii]